MKNSIARTRIHVPQLGGLPKDDAIALTLFQQTCDGGEMSGCSNLGAMYAAGRGDLPKDDAKAVTLYQQACEGSEMLGCSNLAPFQQACDGEFSESCKLLNK